MSSLTAGLAIEPSVGTLRVASGVRSDGTPGTAALVAPPQAARGRSGERLFIMLDLSGPASSRLCRELREVVAQAYWATSGSITAALREAARAANHHLFQFNLRTAPSDRCYGGLACAVVHETDLFMLHTGPAQTCILQRGHLTCYPRDEQVPPMGMGAVTEVRLDHTFFSVGANLLLASASLVQEAAEAGLVRVLPRADMDEILAGLEQLGAVTNFTALVARLVLGEQPAAEKKPAEPPAKKRPRLTLRRRQPEPEPQIVIKSTPQRAESKPRLVEREPGRPQPVIITSTPRAVEPEPEPARRPRQWSRSERESGPPLAERMSKLGGGIKRGAASAGRGVSTLGKRIAGGTRTLFRRMLPGSEEARHRERQRRQAPPDNRPVLIPVAIGIPVLLLILVLLAWQTFGSDARFNSLITQAEREIALAEAPGPAEEAKQHWEQALAYAEQAVALRPDDPQALDLQGQGRDVLDRLSGVIRLSPILLAEFGGSEAPRRLIVRGQEIFVLDPGLGYVTQLTLNAAGDGTMQEDTSPFLRTGDTIDGDEVGNLVDLIWVEAENGRRTSELVILESDGALVSYDPVWESADGSLPLSRSFLGSQPAGEASAVNTFQGRLYILDRVDNQLWRYEPSGDTYPDPPERYFVTAPSKPLDTALDIAIDGNVYILYEDGAIFKFQDRAPLPFDTEGAYGGIGPATAFAVDPNGSGLVYVADVPDGEDSGRILVLAADGAFQTQLRADGEFDQVEALVVDESVMRLYVFGGGNLYVAPLPRLW